MKRRTTTTATTTTIDGHDDKDDGGTSALRHGWLAASFAMAKKYFGSGVVRPLASSTCVDRWAEGHS